MIYNDMGGQGHNTKGRTTTDPLLEPFEFAGRKGVGLADNGDYVDAGRETAHELNVHFTEATNSEKEGSHQSLDQ